MDKRILKMTIFLAIFVVEFIWALKVGFNGGRIAAMVLCLIVAVLAYFNIGKRKWKAPQVQLEELFVYLKTIKTDFWKRQPYQVFPKVH